MQILRLAALAQDDNGCRLTTALPVASFAAMRNTLIAAALGTALLAARSAAQTPRPAVLVLGTGGTIGSAGDYWGGNPTRVPIEQLVKVAGIDSVA
ncbi:MAG: hypothetical protein ABI969_11345, partial [bacterium]